MPEVMEVTPALTEGEKKGKIEEELKPKIELSEEEKQVIALSPEFQRFVLRAARVMERTLCEEQPDIFVDYAKSADADDERWLNTLKRVELRSFFMIV